jgi:hypothetical protein
MRDDGKIGSKVSRLLRVLVAGGVALAGADGVRAAEEPAAPAGSPAPAEKGDKAGEKSKEKSAQKAQGKKESEKPKKAQEEKKPEEGGGVKGW